MSGLAHAGAFEIVLRFHGDLQIFLRKGARGAELNRSLREKTAVKDAIEACGVPHPEIELILCGGKAVGFDHQLAGSAVIDVYPFGNTPSRFASSRLQQTRVDRFVVDGHLGKLARDLRLLGFDAAYDRGADDRALLNVALLEERALLTRDRRLLMHRVLEDGYYPRSQDSEQQTVEVVRRFCLADRVRPYTRCLRCNAALERVPKAEISAELEPLTKAYYHDFRRCCGCGAVYWAGSHFEKLEARIARIRGGIGLGTDSE